MGETAGTVEVIDVPDRSRFEIHVDGEVAGHAEYRLRPERIVLAHTEVGSAYQGQGVAGKLARAALNSARDRGLRVTPLCPYISEYIRRHPEYIPLVDERHRAQVTDPAPEQDPE
jgi:predicted GNAT family acetyltransferase